MTKSKKATEPKNDAPALRVLEENEIVTVSGGDAAATPPPADVSFLKKFSGLAM